MKRCSICKQILDIGEFHKERACNDGLSAKCKTCAAVYRKDYYWRTRDKAVQYAKDWQNKHPTEHRIASLSHSRTNRGKMNLVKRASQKRGLSAFLMFPNPFDESEPVDYHHINDAYIVAVPRDLHRLYLGKFHKEKVMEIVKQLYLTGDRKNE